MKGIFRKAEKKTFEITLQAGEGGIIELAQGSANPVTFGENCTFNFVPDEGYIVKDVVVDGVSEGTVNSYTFTNVRETHALEVLFEDTRGINNPQAISPVLTYQAGVLTVDSKGLNIDKVSVYTVDGKLIAQQQGAATISVGKYPVIIVALEIAGNQSIYKLNLK